MPNVKDAKQRLEWAEMAHSRQGSKVSFEELSNAKAAFTAARTARRLEMAAKNAKACAAISKKMSAAQMQHAFSNIDLKKLFS